MLPYSNVMRKTLFIELPQTFSTYIIISMPFNWNSTKICSLWSPLVVVLLLQISCTEESEIRSYSITPEYEGPVVTWKLPQNWGENSELTGPLAGSFHVKTKLGPMGRIGVMPFRESVSSLEITNMFGMELGYDRFNKESLRKS